MAQKGIIDRFEEEFVVIEIDGKIEDYPRHSIPSEAEVGDVLIIDGDVITIDKDETEKRRKRISKLMVDLWED